MALNTPIGLGEANIITGRLTATYTAAQTKSISIQITGNNAGNGGAGGDIYLDDISFKVITTPADVTLVAGAKVGGTPAVDNLSYGGGLVNAQGGDDVITVIAKRVTPAGIRKMGAFDVTLALSVLHHLPRWRSYLDVLRQSAPILFIETAHPTETLPKAKAHGHTAEMIAEMLDIGAEPICETPGYDAAFMRTTWVVRK
jgi:hypothetical protein